MPDPLADFDPRTIMLERCPLFDKFLLQLGSYFGWSDTEKTRIAWKVAYRSWRAERRVVAFPEEPILATKKTVPSDFKVDWFRWPEKVAL